MCPANDAGAMRRQMADVREFPFQRIAVTCLAWGAEELYDLRGDLRSVLITR
jgi:hypothetical protein